MKKQKVNVAPNSTKGHVLNGTFAKVNASQFSGTMKIENDNHRTLDVSGNRGVFILQEFVSDSYQDSLD